MVSNSLLNIPLRQQYIWQDLNGKKMMEIHYDKLNPWLRKILSKSRNIKKQFNCGLHIFPACKN